MEKTAKDVTLAQTLVNLFETDMIEATIRIANTKDEKKLAENLEKKLADKLAAAQA